MRIHTCGFETGSNQPGREYYDNDDCTIVTDPVRSGVYAARSNNVNGASVNWYAKGEETSVNVIYARCYFRLASVGDENEKVISIEENYDYGASFAHIGIRPNRKLFLGNDFAGDGADTDPIELNRWYRLELKVDATVLNATIIQAKVDGVVIGSATVDMSDVGVGPKEVVCGQNGGGAVAHDMFFDDVGINDETGTFENTYPGEGKIINIHPTACPYFRFLKKNGDPADANNFNQVNEVNPDDATTYLKCLLGDKYDQYIFGTVPIQDYDVIKLLHGYMRCSSDQNNPISALAIEIDNGAGGNYSANFTDLGSSWMAQNDMTLNVISLAINEYYTGVPITKNHLINGDILAGPYVANEGVGYAYITNFWLALEYTEGTPPPPELALPPDPKMPNGYTCFIKQFVKNSLAGNVPPITPDGINRAW